jgi:hypothetical protein
MDRKNNGHEKKNKKTNNGPQEKEQKDKQWSMRKRTKRQTMVHSLSVTCDRMVVFSGYSGFLHQ